MSTTAPRVGLLATHPIQYYAPWYRALAKEVDLEVFFSHRQMPDEQASAGFGVTFDWDVPLLDGYHSTFLRNVAARPGVDSFWGCSTPELVGIIRRRRFDAFIVHGWSTASYWQAILACWRTRTPLLVRGDSTLTAPRAWWWRVVKPAIFGAFIPRFDGYLVVGTRARQYLLRYGADPSRCFDAPHSVDNVFFASACERQRRERVRLRGELGLPVDAVVLLFAGKFVEVKRPEMFVTAVAAASRQAPVAGLMVGDGPLRQAVESSIARLHAPIRLAGFLNQTEMARAYAASDVLVVPSLSETWGLVVNEAMACGLPAVVSDGVGCAPDLVVPGVTGEMFLADSVDALAGHLVALGRDSRYRERLAANAIGHVRRFDVSAAVAGTVRAVQYVSARRKGHANREEAARLVVP